ncbi:MAG: hypothetical protein ACKPKO_06285, partial [Candidatus Fonsibacter sp.]
ANLAAGVPLRPKWALWKLDVEPSPDDLILAVEEFNLTVSEEDAIKSIVSYSAAEDQLVNLWSADRRSQALMPFARRTRHLEVTNWWDIHMRIKD